MSPTARYRLTVALFLLGAPLCLGWAAVSLAAFFDLLPEGSTPARILGALGPLGVILVIVGGTLCRWDLPALRRQAEEDSPPPSKE